LIVPSHRVFSVARTLPERLSPHSGMSRGFGELLHQEIDDEAGQRPGAKPAAHAVQMYKQTEQREDQQEQAECP
jgi:hypothetical protein